MGRGLFCSSGQPYRHRSPAHRFLIGVFRSGLFLCDPVRPFFLPISLSFISTEGSSMGGL